MVIRHCAPALTCIKIESLFSCLCRSYEEVLHGVRELNRRLCSEGLRALPRRRRDGECLVHVSRPRKLARGLKDEHALCFSKRLRILYGQREQKAGADCPCFPLRFRSVQFAHDRMVDMACTLHPAHIHHAAHAQQKALHHAHSVLSVMGMTKRNNVHIVNRLIKLVLKRIARDSIYS